MKKSILFLAYLTSLTSFTFSQWTVLPMNTNQQLMDVAFVTEQVGWVVGRSSTILKTTDGGASWISQQAPINQDFISVFFIDANIGWVSGSLGGIIKTTDGGNSWISQNSGLDYQIESIFFTNENNGYAVVNDWSWDRYGAILQTTDGGQNWIKKVEHTSYGLIDVYFIDEQKGYALGSNGLLWSTNNGGQDWNYDFLSDIWLYSVCFVNETIGWISGGGMSFDYIIKTTNGGLSWIQQRNSFSNGLLSGIAFIDENIGWACGLNGVMLRTTNGGIDWQQDITYVPNDLQEFSFVNGQGYCSGDQGTLLKSTSLTTTIEIIEPNGGEIWEIGASEEILWNSQDIDDVKIEFSSDNGLSWVSIVDSVPSTGNYTCTVPNIFSTQCRIKISDLTDPTNYDISYGNFTILSSKTINLIKPNGGEILVARQQL